MRKLLCAVCLLALLAGCTDAPSPVSAPQSAPADPGQTDNPVFLEELPALGNPAAAMTEDGFFLAEILREGGPRLLTFYDFETVTRRVVCDVPGCTHDSGACPAAVSSDPLRLGDRLYFFENADPDDFAQGFLVSRRDLHGQNSEQLGQIGGEWFFSAGMYTDGASLFTYRGPDFVRIDLPDCHVTMVERANPDKGSDLTSRLTMTAPDGQVYRLGWDPALDASPGHRLTRSGTALYYADPATGWIFCQDASMGQTREVSRGLADYNWSRQQVAGWDEAGAPNRWETHWACENWTGRLIAGVLVVELGAPSPDQMNTYLRAAVDPESGSVTPCPLSTFINGVSRPIRIYAETDRGLLVCCDNPSSVRETMGKDGSFQTWTGYGNVYALIDPQDFLAGVPNYRRFEDKGGFS